MNVSRRQFVQAGVSALSLLAAHGGAAFAAPHGRIDKRPNLVLLFTDQQRQPQHWPTGWVEKNLPSFARLKRHGIEFKNAFTAACQCTPSRATMLTGTYPTVHGVTQTFTPPSLMATGGPLQTFQQNLVRLMGQAGYHVEYKGKWHNSLPIGQSWTDEDAQHLLDAYGVPGWNPPDAGDSITEVSTLGGGWANNDGRYVHGMTPGDTKQVKGWGTSILDFIRTYKGDKPFCLIISLVNPHDIEFFPNGYDRGGYKLEDFENMGISLPPNFRDDYDSKPTIQGLVRDIKNGTAPLSTTKARLDYVNFYAYLQKIADNHISEILDALDARGFTDDTMIFRFADHGENGLSHGMREKVYAAYEEMIHVPMIVSYPKWFSSPLETDALICHADLLPTVAALAGIPTDTGRRLGWVGKDFTPILRNPEAQVQDSILYFFSDGINFRITDHVTHDVPGEIRAIREKSWLYAVYFNSDGTAIEHEMYDMVADPLQTKNLAFEPARPDSALGREWARLHAKLAHELHAKNAQPAGFRWPSNPFTRSV